MSIPEMNNQLSSAPIQTKQQPFAGYLAWLIQRITALILLIVFPLKIYSGYALVGKVPGGAAMNTLHTSTILDTLLVFSVIFHALYGIRVILIDLGVVTDNRSVFKLITILGAILFTVVFIFTIL